jgi:hypothetical protein
MHLTLLKWLSLPELKGLMRSYCMVGALHGVNAEKMQREEIGQYFELTEVSIGPPTIYLGGRMRQVILDNSMNAWRISSSQYVQAAMKNAEKYYWSVEVIFQGKLILQCKHPTV